jgi:hypothetical protein
MLERMPDVTLRKLTDISTPCNLPDWLKANRGNFSVIQTQVYLSYSFATLPAYALDVVARPDGPLTGFTALLSRLASEREHWQRRHSVVGATPILHLPPTIEERNRLAGEPARDGALRRPRYIDHAEADLPPNLAADTPPGPPTPERTRLAEEVGRDDTHPHPRHIDLAAAHLLPNLAADTPADPLTVPPAEPGVPRHEEQWLYDSEGDWEDVQSDDFTGNE